MGDTTIPAIL